MSAALRREKSLGTGRGSFHLVLLFGLRFSCWMIFAHESAKSNCFARRLSDIAKALDDIIDTEL